jgi:hypothetical protein
MRRNPDSTQMGGVEVIGYELEAPLVDADHFRPFWRRSTQIDRLFADGSIRTLDYRAALAYRHLAESIAAAAWGALRVETSDRPSGHDGSTVHRISASQRLVCVRREIGSAAARLCDQVIIADLPWAELGRRYELDPKTMRSRAIAAIALLPAVMWDR